MNTQKMLIKSSLFLATILLVGADFNPQTIPRFPLGDGI